MNEPSSANPLVVTLLCVLRCGIPLLIMLGISYVLKKLGLIRETSRQPQNGDNKHSPGAGGIAHGKA